MYHCQHSLPYVRDWANKYRAAGGGDWRSYPGISTGAFVAPAAPVKDWRITYPVVADNEYAIWNAFGNQVLAGALHFRRSRIAALCRIRRRDYAAGGR